MSWSFRRSKDATTRDNVKGLCHLLIGLDCGIDSRCKIRSRIFRIHFCFHEKTTFVGENGSDLDLSGDF